MSDQFESFKNIEERILKKALKDPIFKKRFLANPREVIKEETGLAVPKKIKIKILEDADDTYTFVIHSANMTRQLSEDELKLMAGGIQIWCC